MTEQHFPLAAVILAGGKGTRMKSNQAKVLHEVFYRPMLHYVLDAVTPLAPDPTVVIVGHQREAVRQATTGYRATCAEQLEQLGTGHAVLCAEQALASYSGTVLILCGDSPLLLPEHLAEMVARHRSAAATLTIMTTRLHTPTNYGRIITDDDGNVLRIVEEKDATDRQRQITEINAGMYCVEKSFLFKALSRVTTDNSQKELYLTDIVAIAVDDGISVGRYEHPCPAHVLGVNSRIELAQAHEEIRDRRNRQLLAGGVTMHAPCSVAVAQSVSIEADCVLSERITITGTTTIGAGCLIEPGVVMNDCTIGAGARIGANSVLRNATVPPGARIASLSFLDGGGADTRQK